MDPTPTPTPPPNAPAPDTFAPVVELIRTQRQNVGFGLTALAALFLIAAVMLGVKSQQLAATAPSTATDKDGKDSPDDMLKGLKVDGSEVTQPNRYDYVIGAFGCVLGLLILGGGAALLVVGLPKPTEALQRREARVLLLAVGGLLGVILLLVGIWFFYRWSDSLMKWLDKGELKEARWVLIPLLMIVAGGGIVFAAIQPARAEERNNTLIRRLVYGSNFGLTVLILFVVLVIANAVVAMRVPNKLDTTSTGFYTLSPQTEQVLKSLDQPVHVYAIFQESGDLVTADLKRMLENCRDTNPSKFQVTFLSPALNKTDIAKLKTDYPLAEMSREGVLLVAGEDTGERKRHSFIRSDEFEETTSGPDGRPTLAFNGEPKLLRELMFLAENKQKPKVYFTQSSGELTLGAARRGANPRRSAASLRSYLEKNYFDVAELNFEVAGTAKVPDDAAVVVVADPTAPLPPNGVEAIRKFMSEPRPDGKKGKLVVLAGAQAGPDGKALKTGLEPILGTFGVRLGEGFMYGKPLPQLGDWDGAEGTRVHLALITQDAVDAKNPVALNFNKVDRLPLVDCREVVSGQAGAAQAVTVLASQPGRLTWVEQTRPNSPSRAWAALGERVQQIEDGPGSRAEKNKLLEEFQVQMQLSTSPRELAVFVSESGMPGSGQLPTARVAVFGCGWFVSDDAGTRAAGISRGTAPTLWLDMMGSTLDWVRDRPTASLPNEKPYTAYTLKPGYDQNRLLYVPLGVGFLIVIGLGAGMWVIRRK